MTLDQIFVGQWSNRWLKIAMRQQCPSPHLILKPTHPWVCRWAQVHLLFNQRGGKMTTVSRSETSNDICAPLWVLCAGFKGPRYHIRRLSSHPFFHSSFHLLSILSFPPSPLSPVSSSFILNVLSSSPQSSLLFLCLLPIMHALRVQRSFCPLNLSLTSLLSMAQNNKKRCTALLHSSYITLINPRGLL